MATRILVPIDFEPASDEALEYARLIASQFQGTVHALHVLPNLFLRPVVSNPHDLKTAALHQLADRLANADHRGFEATVAVELSDDPADEIVSYARTHDINLIVMGTHGRTGVAHALIGSVAEKVVRTAPCSVLTVRAKSLTARAKSGVGAATPA
jgi:nucleotide-binding universal stress UspA family protein